MKTFDKKSNKVAPPRKQRTFPVWVVVRHTRAGDHRIAVIDNKIPYNREHAMSMAEDIANEAAQNYGQGSASVYKGTLTLAVKPEMP